MPSPDCLHNESLLSRPECLVDHASREGSAQADICEPTWVKVNYWRLSLLRPSLTLPNTLKRKIEDSEIKESKKAKKERKKEKKLKKKKHSSPQNSRENSHVTIIDPIPKSHSIPTIPEVESDDGHRPSPISDHEILAKKIQREKFQEMSQRKRPSRETSLEKSSGSTTKKPTTTCPTGTVQ